MTIAGPKRIIDRLKCYCDVRVAFPTMPPSRRCWTPRKSDRQPRREWGYTATEQRVDARPVPYQGRDLRQELERHRKRNLPAPMLAFEANQLIRKQEERDATRAIRSQELETMLPREKRRRARRLTTS